MCKIVGLRGCPGGKMKGLSRFLSFAFMAMCIVVGGNAWAGTDCGRPSNNKYKRNNVCYPCSDVNAYMWHGDYGQDNYYSTAVSSCGNDSLSCANGYIEADSIRKDGAKVCCKKKYVFVSVHDNYFYCMDEKPGYEDAVNWTMGSPYIVEDDSVWNNTFTCSTGYTRVARFWNGYANENSSTSRDVSLGGLWACCPNDRVFYGPRKDSNGNRLAFCCDDTINFRPSYGTTNSECVKIGSANEFRCKNKYEFRLSTMGNDPELDAGYSSLNAVNRAYWSCSDDVSINVYSTSYGPPGSTSESAKCYAPQKDTNGYIIGYDKNIDGSDRDGTTYLHCQVDVDVTGKTGCTGNKIIKRYMLDPDVTYWNTSTSLTNDSQWDVIAKKVYNNGSEAKKASSGNWKVWEVAFTAQKGYRKDIAGEQCVRCTGNTYSPDDENNLIDCIQVPANAEPTSDYTDWKCLYPDSRNNYWTRVGDHCELYDREHTVEINGALVCDKGYYRSGTSCVACPQDTYKSTYSVADDAAGINSCKSCESDKINTYYWKSGTGTTKWTAREACPQTGMTAPLCGRNHYYVASTETCTPCPTPTAKIADTIADMETLGWDNRSIRQCNYCHENYYGSGYANSNTIMDCTACPFTARLTALGVCTHGRTDANFDYWPTTVADCYIGVYTDGHDVWEDPTGKFEMASSGSEWMCKNTGFVADSDITICQPTAGQYCVRVTLPLVSGSNCQTNLSNKYGITPGSAVDLMRVSGYWFCNDSLELATGFRDCMLGNGTGCEQCVSSSNIEIVQISE